MDTLLPKEPRSECGKSQPVTLGDQRTPCGDAAEDGRGVRIRVTVDDQSGAEPRHVTAVAEPGAAANQVLNEIARAANVHGSLWGAATKLAGDQSIGALDVHDGDILGVGAPGRSVRDTVGSGMEVRVVGGPAAGNVVRIGPGRFEVGRHSACQVTIHDPEMSRRHAVVQVSSTGSMTIADLGSANGTVLEGAVVGQTPVPLAFGEVFQLGQSFAQVCAVDPIDGALIDDGECGYVFNRRYRLRGAQAETKIEFPAPPREGERPSFPWLMMGAPLVVAVAMAAALKQPEFLLLAVMSPVMTLGSTAHDRRTRKRKQAKDAAEYQSGMVEATSRMEQAVAAERSRRRTEAPDPATLVLTATGPRARLWERRPTDDDWLRLRVGLATLPSSVVVANRPEPPPAWAVPVVVPVSDAGVVGIAAPLDIRRGVARTLLLHAAVLHSPDDLRVVVLTDPDAETEWDWLRWLPHAQLDRERGPVSIGNDPDTHAIRLKELQSLVMSRSARAGRGLSELAPLPHVLVIIDGARQLRGIPGMLPVLQQGFDAGVYSVCLDEDRSLLPEECGAVLTWNSTSGTAVLEQHGEMPIAGVALDRPLGAVSAAAARGMAPIHRVGGDSASGEVPASARLLEIAAIDPPTPTRVTQGWTASDRGPRALIGVAQHGPLVLDLARDGPHGLVAGTTGAGKSELLQTLVAGLCLRLPPEELNVVLVDYKGGAAFQDCGELPHCVGVVTDLDSHLTERALRSLRAELKRREQILSRAGAKDIGDFLEARLRRDTALEDLPRLVIVIDEFASLAIELPDFIKGLVGIAQRGRSLGVHLVLATQRPTGVVSPEIRANANFAIALRVVNQSESADIIGTAEAARISPTTPGRAYLRVSQEAPVCFQTARVGGRRPGEADPTLVVSAFVTPWRDVGHPDPPVPVAAAPAADATDLHDLVRAIRAAASERGTTAQRRPWLDPLPEILTLDELSGWSEFDGSRAGSAVQATDDSLPPLAFGLTDLPDAQMQRLALLDLAAGRHMLVAGSPRSGRSSALLGIGAAAGRQYPVDDLHLYGLDCGRGSLLPLRELPHCGAIVTRTELERAERLLVRLAAEVRTRQAAMVERGFTGAPEQRCHARDCHSEKNEERPWPYILLLVDDWEGFLDAFHDHKDGYVERLLLGVLRDGGPVGLAVVMTGDRSLVSTARVSSLFEDRFVLRFNDRADYSLADLSPRAVPERVRPGRAFRAATGEELQIALLAADPSGPAQAAALDAIVGAARRRAASQPPQRAPLRIDPLPTRITTADAVALGTGHGNDRPTSSALTVLIGVGGDELRPFWVNIVAAGPGFIIAGASESGRSTALAAMGAQLAAGGCEVVAVAPRAGPLLDLGGLPGVTVLEGQRARSPSAALDAASLVAVPNGEHPIVAIVDDAELIDADDKWLVDLITAEPGRGAVLVSGSIEQIRDDFRGFVFQARRNGSGLLLCPKSHLDAGIFNATLPRGAGFAGPPGRGYLFVRNRQLGLVQVSVP